MTTAYLQNYLSLPASFSFPCLRNKIETTINHQIPDEVLINSDIKLINLIKLTSALLPNCSRSLLQVHFPDAIDRHWLVRPRERRGESAPARNER